MANHRGVKLCKAEGQYTENTTANVQMLGTVFTHNLSLSGFFTRGAFSLLQLRFCSSFQLGLSLWPRELENRPRSWRRRRLFNSSETLLVKRGKREPVGRIAQTSSLTIFLCNPSVLCEGTTRRQNFLACCLSQISAPRHSLEGLWPPPFRL